MPNYLGVDLGGTNLTCVLANESGDFLHRKTCASPYRITCGTLPDGSPEIFIDTVLADVPLQKRVAEYLARTEAEFLKGAGSPKIAAKGYSLCGKTWIHGGEIRMMGGNTPLRLGIDPGDGKIGIAVAPSGENVVAANDGNAAAHAQGIYYRAMEGIAPRETGYMILGTGFGFGVPGYFALTEIGHIPVAFMPEPLWQSCGCTEGKRTACAENFASGRGIRNTAERLFRLDAATLARISVQLAPVAGGVDLSESVHRTRLVKGDIDTEIVMRLAKDGADPLAGFVVELAAFITAYAAIHAAYFFGLRRIGLGETVARLNPWHVDRISAIAADYLRGSTLLRPPLRIEMTPIADPADFGALSLAVPESQYGAWAEKMTR